MRYLIRHQSDCPCPRPLAVPALLHTPRDVMLSCWGLDMQRHLIYDGECPYAFATDNPTVIEKVLAMYPVRHVRHVLPLRIPAAVLWQVGVKLAGWHADATVCQIGGITPEA